MSFLTDLATKISEADLTVAQQRHEAQRGLSALRDGMLADAADYTGFLDAALALVTMIPVLDEREAEQAAGLTRRLIELALPRVSPPSGRVATTQEASPTPSAPTPAPAPSTAAPHTVGEMTLGQLLVQFGYASTKAVARAISQQAIEPDKRLGQILIEDGELTEPELQYALRLQQQFLRGALEDLKHRRRLEELKMGKIMLRLKHITPETLVDALRAQNARGGKLGEVLVNMAAVTWDQVAEALREQKAEKKRHGVE